MSPNRSPSRIRQRGYVMAMLLVFCVISGIVLSRAVPYEPTMVQRELEEELIFRGESYASAIRQYRQRTGQFPTALEQLVQTKPRMIRKIYECPLSRAPFAVVTAVPPGATGVTTNLPIVGVRSTSNLNAKKRYKGKDLVSDWVFSATEDLYGGGATAPVRPPIAGGQGQPPTGTPGK